MKIDLVTLCDAAVEVNGRLHVLGSIDYFWSATLPYTHRQCTLAVRFRWDGHERLRKHKLRVQVLDADGGTIATDFERKIAPPHPLNDDVPVLRHMILELDSLRFEHYGPYAVRIDVDGEELACLPFSIVPASQLQRQGTIS